MGRLGVQGHSRLLRKSETNRGYMKPVSRKKEGPIRREACREALEPAGKGAQIVQEWASLSVPAIFGHWLETLWGLNEAWQSF